MIKHSAMTDKKPKNSANAVRLDKWLWCARFYKTRDLAMEAIKSGKVRFESGRIKPSRTVRPGELYTIRSGPYTSTIAVKSLADQRRSAAEAVLLYEETADSLKTRTLLKEQLKLNNAMHPHPKGRPTKRERRKLIRFTQKTG